MLRGRQQAQHDYHQAQQLFTGSTPGLDGYRQAHQVSTGFDRYVGVWGHEAHGAMRTYGAARPLGPLTPAPPLHFANPSIRLLKPQDIKYFWSNYSEFLGPKYSNERLQNV